MQVKKFEAPTLQEALDTIKRELGPEAIILQTKQNRRGFGLMSKGSVEVTAAVSERASEKKSAVEKRIPEGYKQKLAQASASKQADVYESYLEKRVERDQVQLSKLPANGAKKITATRYADIADDGSASLSNSVNEPIPEYRTPVSVGAAVDHYASSKDNSIQALQNELENLKKLVEDLRKEKKRPEYLDSDSPYAATDALEAAYDLLIQSGIERRHAIQVMRDTSRALGVETRADHDSVLDQVADQLLKRISIESFFERRSNAGSQSIHAFVGTTGAGKTALIAKLGTHASRVRQEKIGIIRINIASEESVDPLVILAKALHVPYRSVSSSEELNVAIQDMSQCSRLFIDTPGIPTRDLASVRRLGSILANHASIHVNLVANSTIRDQELRETAKTYKELSPRALMFTRLDEAFTLGSVYSLSQHLSLPVSVFANGRKVTENWENASAERLTAAILNIL
jgi:flagellar biosynthesis protein FlhF